MKGSPVSVQVDANGWVKIYGDASKIDYFNASGQEIDQIQFSDQLGLKILNLEHNSLQALNINKLQKLQVIYLEDNPFTATSPCSVVVKLAFPTSASSPPLPPSTLSVVESVAPRDR